MESGLNAKHLNSSDRRESSKPDFLQTENPQTDLSEPSPRKSKSQHDAKLLALVSPGGDDRVVLTSEDFDNGENIAGILASAVYSTKTLTQNPTSLYPATSNPLPPTKQNNEEVIIIQDKGRFRKGTRKDLEFKQLKSDKKERLLQGGGNIQSREYQIAYLIKNVQLYSMAVSYLSYGLLAGLGMTTLLIYPIIPPQILPTRSLTDMLGYVSNDFIRFFDSYSPVCLSISNTFSLLTIIVLITALETRHFAYQAMRKVEDLKHISVEKNNEHSQEHALQEQDNSKVASRLKRRMLITNLLCFSAFIAFASNICLFALDDIWHDSQSKSNSVSGQISSVQISKGPYPLSTISYNAISSSDTTLSWFWQYAAYSHGLNPMDLTTTAISFDLTFWAICNCVRGSFSVITWLIALLEIRYRATTLSHKH